jgi:nicotinamide mononucleotide transporter
MSWVEILGSLTGLASVYLMARNNIWNWWWGVANALLFGWLFLSSRLYSDALLQIAYFLPMQFYGWWVWKKAGPRHADDLPVTRLSWSACGLILLLIILASAGWGELVKTHTNAAQPFLDATLAMASVAAQYLDTRKKLESWWLWIAVDVFSVFYLYPKQHLYVTTGVYAVFLIISVAGLWRWTMLAREKERAAL